MINGIKTENRNLYTEVFHNNEKWNCSFVIYIKLNDVGCNKRAMEKVYRVFDYKGVKNMEFAFRSAGK